MRLPLFIIFLLILLIGLSQINIISCQQIDDLGTMKITIDFLIPMVPADEGKVKLVSSRPGANIIKSCRWIDTRTLEIIAMEEGQPKGHEIKLRTGPLKSKVPGLYKRAKYKYQANIRPYPINFPSIGPSQGPVLMSLTTPIPGDKLVKHLKLDFPYQLEAEYIRQGAPKKPFKDESKWQIIPQVKLTPGKAYAICYHDPIGEDTFYKTFKAALPPTLVATDPEPGQRDVILYTPIVIDFDEDMQEVSIEVEGMLGDVEYTGNRGIYKPRSVYLPGKEYQVKVMGKSHLGESLPTYHFSFHTLDMEDKYWVEINLRPIQKLVVYRGDKAIRTMVASGGLEDEDNATPLGYFLLKDRGERFFTQRIQEGGLYWVRITGNWLIHSMPRNKDDEIIPEELAKHGIPASHGCVRLKDQEAKWFYDNIPIGTPCYIHD